MDDGGLSAVTEQHLNKVHEHIAKQWDAFEEFLNILHCIKFLEYGKEEQEGFGKGVDKGKKGYRESRSKSRSILSSQNVE